jgi:predicted O-methyltransferase YrrM
MPSLQGSTKRAMNLLAPAYYRYVGAVSSAEMAVSLETAGCLYAICSMLGPSSILDLGSGFSSYALRNFAATAGHRTVVHTVDDDAAWLQRTASFLRDTGTTTDHMTTWKDFANQTKDAFQLVFHDLGRMPMRTATLQRAIGFAARTGIIVFDDVHKPSYAAEVSHCCAREGLAIIDLSSLTQDQYGRVSWLGFRAQKKPRSKCSAYGS